MFITFIIFDSFKTSQFVQGSDVVVYFDGKFLARATSPTKIRNGYVGYGTTTFGIADFDNFSIE